MIASGKLQTAVALSMAGVVAQSAPAPAVESPKGGIEECPAIPLIRYEVEGRAFRAPACEAQAGRFWRYIAPDPPASASVSIGGEMRQRYEYTHNPGFGADPQDAHGVWLQRWGLHGEFQLGAPMRVFVELQSVIQSGRADGPGPTDQNSLDMQNAFVELRLPSSNGSPIIRVGRQELQFGSARLVSVRDKPNVRRTFDGARILVKVTDWQVSALGVRPREDEPGAFDDTTDNTKELRGLYATVVPDSERSVGVDLYYIGYRDDHAVFDQGRGVEPRHMVGTRIFGSRGGWRWNWKPMLQFGRFETGTLRAWTVASETGYTWATIPFHPRLMLSANVARGDRNPLDPDLQTFKPLFPRGNYFSEDATLGPRNFYNAHLFLSVHPSKSWSLTADYDAFWRLSIGDGVYGPGGGLVRSVGGSAARCVATAASLTSEWLASPHWRLSFAYTHLSPKTFLEETGPAESVDFIELTARCRF